MIITVVRKFDFTSYAPTASAAVIRIYDPVEDWFDDASQLSVAGWGDVLSLSFWDVGVQGMRPGEGLLTRLLGHWRTTCLALGTRLFGDPEIPWRPFLAADARDIARFAAALEAKGIRHLMVVCGNGRARSWTIAKWLSHRLSASLTASHGWQHESLAILEVLKRVRPTRPAGSAAALASLSAAE